MMAKRTDWLPGTRTGQLDMCRNWLDIMDADTRAAWSIPAPRFQELEDLFEAAQAILQKARNEDERTHVVTVQVQEAFRAMTDAQRFFKKHYFLAPPLVLADFVRLGLKVPGPSGPVPPPENQVVADLVFPGIHLVELQKIRPVAGMPPDSRGDYGVRIYYGLTGPATETFRFRLSGPPKSGGDLPYSIFTGRRKERVDFDGESGNTVYFCLRYERRKGGREGMGPFGPILHAVIP
jgi:hypothetical protein